MHFCPYCSNDKMRIEAIPGLLDIASSKISLRISLHEAWYRDKGIIIPVIFRSTITNNPVVGGPRIDIYANHCAASRISHKT